MVGYLFSVSIMDLTKIQTFRAVFKGTDITGIMNDRDCGIYAAVLLGDQDDGCLFDFAVDAKGIARLKGIPLLTPAVSKIEFEEMREQYAQQLLIFRALHKADGLRTIPRIERWYERGSTKDSQLLVT